MLARIEGSTLVAEGVITDSERKALIEVRDRIRRGEVTTEAHEHDPSHFDMANWLHCIYGHCEQIDQQAFVQLRRVPRADVDSRLVNLFLPDEAMFHDRTPAEAEHAITTFLATGIAQWSDRP